MANAMIESLPDSAMPPKKTARFPRTARLLRHADFERVYKEGRRIFSQSMTVFYLRRTGQDKESQPVLSDLERREREPKGLPPPSGLRVGFTVGRALGGAVQRNRMKRRLREAVRQSLPATSIAADIVINPKKSILEAEFGDILNEVKRGLAKVEQELLKKCEPGRT